MMNKYALAKLTNDWQLEDYGIHNILMIIENMVQEEHLKLIEEMNSKNK